jgi:hypothetical protein
MLKVKETFLKEWNGKIYPWYVTYDNEVFKPHLESGEIKYWIKVKEPIEMV